MAEDSNSMQKQWKLVTRSILCLAVIGMLVSQAAAQGGSIVLDGVGDDWDPAWQVAADGLDVFLTDTGAHPHDPPTYARSGYDAIGLWARYQADDDAHEHAEPNLYSPGAIGPATRCSRGDDDDLVAKWTGRTGGLCSFAVAGEAPEVI